MDLPEPPCSWIATAGRRELLRALPLAAAPVLLSRVAWKLSEPRLAGLIAPGDAELPWYLTPDGYHEALAVQRAAIARREKPMRLDARREAVLRDLRQACFGRGAAAALVRLLGAHGIAVSGVLSSGERVPLDPLLLPQLVFDLANDLAWTADETVRWRALAATRSADTVVPQPLARRTVQSELARWYRETYPSGHPVGRKLDLLAFEATQAIGRTVSPRTMRRAVIDVRRTTAAN